jgi:RimJ/RimL family protein N-acetyltransferase
METRPYQDGDMQFVREHALQKEVKDYPELLVPADTYTCIHDGHIVAIGGIKMFFEGVGESWVMFTEYVKTEGVWGIMASRVIQNKLEELMAELKVRRCEANVRADFPVALRFVEALGFTLDGERKQWFPGGTSAMLYSKVTNV